VLQCVAVCCSVLQCVAVCYRQCVAWHKKWTPLFEYGQNMYDNFHWNATPPKSTKSRSSDSSVSRSTNSNSNFDLICIGTEEFEFLDLVDCVYNYIYSLYILSIYSQKRIYCRYIIWAYTELFWKCARLFPEYIGFFLRYIRTCFIRAAAHTHASSRCVAVFVWWTNVLDSSQDM